MKPQSAKAKGRNLQKLVREKILENFPQLRPDDVVSRSMGAGGEDIMLSPLARDILGVSFECKNVEKINVWDAYAQAEYNAKEYYPVLVIKKNHKEPLAVIDLDYFLDLIKLSLTHRGL